MAADALNRRPGCFAMAATAGIMGPGFAQSRDFTRTGRMAVGTILQQLLVFPVGEIYHALRCRKLDTLVADSLCPASRGRGLGNSCGRAFCRVSGKYCCYGQERNRCQHNQSIHHDVSSYQVCGKRNFLYQHYILWQAKQRVPLFFSAR
jgi:hypothetical protein